jgi:hypothetical protein
MPYYYFNRFSKEKLPQLEELADKLNLTPCHNDKVKYWGGNPLKDNYSDWQIEVFYKDYHQFPLQIQTRHNRDHKDPLVLSILKQFIAIAKPTKIYWDISHTYDMAEFQ